MSERPSATGQRKKRGRWTYDPGVGWRLDGTDLVLDFDRLDHGGDLPGAWLLSGTHGGKTHYDEPIDHYLRSAMEWVEKEIAA